MSDETEVEQAGIVGPHRESHEPRLNALNFLAPGVTPVSGYLQWSGVQPIGEKWGMADNATKSCCGFSYWQHNNMAKAAANGEEWKNVYETTWRPKYQTLLEAYYAYGIAQGEPGPDPDEGVDNASMFAWAYKEGLIDGYLEVPIEYADWFGMTFHGHAIGQVLNANTAINDFDAKPRIPWSAMGKEDGHDTLGIEGDGTGGGLEVTWGGLQPYDVTYRENNWTDCWVIVDKEDPNVDQAALKAILTQLHGVVSASAAADTPAPGSAADDGEQDLLRAFGDVVKDLKSLVAVEIAKRPELEKALKHEIVKALESSIPAILSKVLERLALEALPEVI